MSPDPIVIIREPVNQVVESSDATVTVSSMPAVVVTVTDPMNSAVIQRETDNLVEVSAVGTQGPVGPQGPSGQTVVEAFAGMVLSGHRLVSPNNAGAVVYADNTTIAHRPVWLTTSAVVNGELASLLAIGELTEPSWSWTPGLALYLGHDGLLTQAPPAAPDAVYLLDVGAAVTPTTIYFDPQPPIALSS